MWDSLFICLLPSDISNSNSICQLVSATPCLSYLLFADLSDLASMLVLSLVCYVHHLLTSPFLCLCLPGCELPLVHLICCLLISLSLSLTSMWVPPLVCPIHCLLTSLFLCLCSSGCECLPLFILLAVYWPLLLCLYLPVCECCMVCTLFISFAFCWPLSCSVSVHQHVSPHLSCSCLLTSPSLSTSVCVPAIICHLYCLLISFLLCLCL